MSPRRRTLLPSYGLFLLSGASGLLLEVLWQERLGRIFGASAEAAAATLAAFFLGLGLGAAFWGRRAGRLARPLAAYGGLEIAVAVTAALAFLLLPLEGRLYGVLVGSVAESGALLTVVRLSLAALLLVPAAFFLGGTLPVLGEHVAPDGARLGARGGLLYGVNTLGAAAGALLGGVLLPPRLGLDGTYLLAMALSAAVGAVAWILGRAAARPTAAPPLATRERAGRASGHRAGTAALAFTSGALALALEVLWIRMFAQALPNSVYVFTIVLVAFLVSLGLGGLLASVLARTHARPANVLAGLLGGAGFLVAASVPLFLVRSEGLRPPSGAEGWTAYLGAGVLDALIVIVPAGVVLGAVFPYLFKVAAGSGAGAGRVLGRLAAWNTAGAIVGSLAAGFVLLVTLGLWSSIRLAALAYALLALGVALRGGGRVVQALSGVVVIAVAASFANRPPPLRLHAGERLLDVWEAPSGTVAVIETPSTRKIVFNNVFTLGGTHDARWEAMQAHVPLCVHPAPKDAFFLGLGTGITAGGAVDHGLRRLVVAELVPEVVEAARRHFGRYTNGLFQDERAHVLASDARHRLRWTDARYDVIVGDLFFPWEPGTASLYTREHFEAVRARLRPGGIFAQWLPCYQLAEDELLGIGRTMVEAFPRVTVWRGDFFSGRPILAIVGHRDEAPLDAEALVGNARHLIASTGRDLARDADTVPFHLYVGNLTAAADAVLQDARPLTDDQPWITWSAPRSERLHQRDTATLAVGDRLLELEERIQAACPPGEDPYLAALDDVQRKRVRAGLEMRRMAVHLKAFRRAEHAKALRAYVRLVPAADRPPLDVWIEP